MNLSHSSRKRVKKLAIIVLAIASIIGVIAFVETAVEKAIYMSSIKEGVDLGNSPMPKKMESLPNYDNDLQEEALFVLLCAGILVWLGVPKKKKFRITRSL